MGQRTDIHRSPKYIFKISPILLLKYLLELWVASVRDSAIQIATYSALRCTLLMENSQLLFKKLTREHVTSIKTIGTLSAVI